MIKLHYYFRNKCVCNRFLGVFEPVGWETIIRMAKEINKINIRIIETSSKNILCITSESGALNLIAEPETLVVKGNVFLNSESIKEIPELPLWRLFESIARTFCINAPLTFEPYREGKLEYKEGILQETRKSDEVEELDQISFFLQRSWINYLLEQLHTAMMTNEVTKIEDVKQRLKAIINQSLN